MTERGFFSCVYYYTYSFIIWLGEGWGGVFQQALFEKVYRLARCGGHWDFSVLICRAIALFQKGHRRPTNFMPYGGSRLQNREE